MTHLRDKLAGLRARLAARPDTEHEQAIVRLVIGALLVLYLLPDALARSAEPHVYVLGAYLVIAVIVFLRILASQEVSHTRRVFATLADVITLTWCMSVFDERGAPLFLVYVWVSLANGFRFGPRYLVATLALSVIGFGVVLATSAFWQAHLHAGIGLMIGMVALSVYVLSLVKRMFDALARAESANQAKRRFISVVSHEMRTPLNAIIGMADLMRDTSLNREQADMLQTLRGASRVMLGLVEDVLDFSKIEAGKLVLERTDFDLHALVNSTCRIISSQAAAKNVEFVVSIMPQVPPAVHGDPLHLRQILINLAGNAVKFTERGSVTVHVSVEHETAASARVKFSVRDTGIGVPPEAQKQIFESFTQAEKSTSRRFGGTGLGTTIAKQLVELMGGHIGLESAVGLGSTFWFEIPLAKQAEQPGAVGGELAGARVLLIGFPRAERERFDQALASWGAAPVAAASVEEGVQRMIAEISLARPYHSALLYAGAPGQEMRLVEQFRRAAPNPAPPAVLCVAPEAGTLRFSALSAGYSAVLELPFDKRQLFNALHSVAAGEELRGDVVRLEDYARRGGTLRKLKVLVADDNPTNREVLGRILERGGHAATVVEDGEQALDAMELTRFDVVLLDRNMPGLGGLETLQAIRLTTRGRERLPVIVLSADVTPEARRECLEAGADAFLSKPIEAARLLVQVQELAAKPADSAPRPAAPLRPARAPAAQGAAAVVDRETLARLEELGSASGFMEKLIGVFIADNVVLLARMENAVAARNFAELRNLLHAMKGAVASMGADRLTRLCSSIYADSDAELRLRSPMLVKSLSEEFDAVRTELERYLRDKRHSAG